MKWGKGKYTYADGSYYAGQFHKNMRSGAGKFVWADGSVYEGRWY